MTFPTCGFTRADRRGFTIVEIVVALAALAVVMLVAAQLATSSALQRVRLAARQAALELADNVLEAARAEESAALTPAWAAAQSRIPAETNLPAGARLLVQVEPEAAAPGARRVLVEVRWQFHEDDPEQALQLVGVFGPRAAAGGKP